MTALSNATVVAPYDWPWPTATASSGSTTMTSGWWSGYPRQGISAVTSASTTGGWGQEPLLWAACVVSWSACRNLEAGP